MVLNTTPTACQQTEEIQDFPDNKLNEDYTDYFGKPILTLYEDKSKQNPFRAENFLPDNLTTVDLFDNQNQGLGKYERG